MGLGIKITRKLGVDEFNEITKKYSKEDIVCTDHTFFRLSQKQKKIYTEEEIIKIVKSEIPFLVGIQENGNYSAFYEYKGRICRVILAINTRKINIVTFYFINDWQVPRI